MAVGTPYALTFTLDLQPPPAAGTGLLAYTRRYGLVGYSVQLGDYETAGTGRVALVHRPYDRDRVIVWGDDGEALLRLAGDSAAAFLAGRVGPEAPSAPLAVLSAPTLTWSGGTFDTSAGAAGYVNQLALAPAAPASAVPLPPAAWGGLVLLGALAATKLRGRKRE